MEVYKVLIDNDGTQYWEDEHGELHRKNGPAVISPNTGYKAYLLHGSYHREDGPAIIYPNGDEVWYLYDKKHRWDGPAVVNKNGHKEWWVNNKKHREDGPAVIYNDGTEEYWLNNKQVCRNDLPCNEVKELTVKQVEKVNCKLKERQMESKDFESAEKFMDDNGFYFASNETQLKVAQQFCTYGKWRKLTSDLIENNRESIENFFVPIWVDNKNKMPWSLNKFMKKKNVFHKDEILNLDLLEEGNFPIDVNVKFERYVSEEKAEVVVCGTNYSIIVRVKNLYRTYKE